MAATVVDELVVILGLDSSKFTDGQKKVAEEYVRLKTAAQRNSSEVERHTESMTKTFSALQGKLLAITALFLGGMGIKEFGEHVANLTNQLGRLSLQAGISAADLSAWGNAGAAVGANAGNVRSAVQGLAAAGNQIEPNTSLYGTLAAMGMLPRRFPNGDLDVNGTLIGMSEWAASKRQQGWGPGRITGGLMHMPGMNADMASLLLQGPEKVRALLAEMQKLGPTPEQVKAIQDVNKAWTELQAHLEQTARVIETQLAPFLEKVLKIIQNSVDWLDNRSKQYETPQAAAKALHEQLKEPIGASPQSPWSRWMGGIRNWWNGTPTPTPQSAPVQPPAAGQQQAVGGAAFTGNNASVKSDIKRQFSAAGVPDTGVAGILANVQRESNFNPNIRVPDQPRWSGEAHYAHGLYQEGGAEWNNYAAWLNSNHPGHSWRDPQMQTAFLIDNLKKNYPDVWAALKNPSLSAGQKAMIFQRGYLKPKYTHSADQAVAEQFMRNINRIPTADDVWGRTGFTPMQARNANVMGNSTVNSKSITASTTVGEVHVHPPGGSPYDIAKGIHGALINTNPIAQSETGPW